MGKQIYMRFPGGKAKALTLSYDDGVEQDRTMIEILNRHGLKCTFNLNSGLYAEEGKVYEPGTIHRRMSKSAVTGLYTGSGHEVAVHGLTHPFLETLPSAKVVFEIMQDRLNLEQQFGCLVRGMAYPYGTFNDSVVECLKACGIAYSRTTVSTQKFEIPTDWLRMPATCHHNDANLPTLTDRFLNMSVNDKPKLFYLWGHTYEFERDNNWNVIEEFAEKMGNREDIWYATNIEIYDYVQDYQRLIWSADGNTVYNPTCRTIFFGNKNLQLSAAPGETVSIE